MVLELATIRSLLIRAWRERWSDIQWGIHIKTVLPRYISGDIYHLSDCLLQQALMGSLPNNLILSYLKHSLSSQVVSHGGVMDSISKFDGFHKPHCLHALLDLLLSIMKSVSCRGKPEDCLMLATSLVAGVKWLLMVMTLATEKLIDLPSAPEDSTNLNLAGSVLLEVLQSPFLVCMLQIGTKEDDNVWKDCLAKISQLETHLNDNSGLIVNKDLLLHTITEIKELKPTKSLYGAMICKGIQLPFNHSVFTLVMLEVITHTTRDAEVFAHQLLLLKEFKGFSLTELYTELLKACFIGMSAVEYKQYQELKWVGFTYIKVPSIITTLHSIFHGESHLGPSEELCTAVKRVASMITLLDVADYRVNCNCLEYLLKEFLPKVTQQTQQTSQVNLLLEKDAQTILANRIHSSNALRSLQNNDSQSPRPGNPDLILRAQPPVVNILKTLSNKNTESVLTVLSLLISGKSRELLLIAAASSGNLHIYAQKFVKLNEQTKEGLPGETSKAAMNRAVVFDISFLLLCHIAQIYGTDVVVSQNKETFIEKWIQDNIPENGKVKSSHQNTNIETTIIEEFLRQINCLESDTKYTQCNWGETSKIASVALKEVLCASHNGHVVKQMIFDLLNRLSFHLCSLSISVAAFLCSHIQQVDGEEANQAIEFLTYMQKNLVSLEPPNVCLEYFKDRSNMMSEIIDNMVSVMKGSAQLQKNGAIGHQDQEWSLEPPTPLSELTADVWSDINSSAGLVSHKALSLSQDLLRLGGTGWFVSSFVKAAMEKVFEGEINRSIDVVYSLFHMDIVGCTLSLLVHTLPNYISGPLTVDLMCEPRTSALARLTAMLVVSCWAAVQPVSEPPQDGNSSSTHIPLPANNRGKKRSFLTSELEDIQGRLSEQLGEATMDYSSLRVGPEGCALLSAVHALFQLMTQMTRSGIVSPVTHLTVFLLKELVSMPHTSALLDLPTPLLTNLLHLLSPFLCFNYPQLLALTSPELLQQQGSATFAGDAVYCASAKAKSTRQAAAKILCVNRCLELTTGGNFQHL